MLPREISLKEAKNSASAAAILKKVFSGHTDKCDFMPPNLNLAGSLKCGWLSTMLSGFSCLVSCVKRPSCSAPGCIVQIDRIKIQKNVLNFHNLPFRDKTLAEKWLDQLRRDVRFMT